MLQLLRHAQTKAPSKGNNRSPAAVLAPQALSRREHHLTPCSAVLQLLSRAQKEAASKARANSLAAAPPVGAHVVAPCPHDGACPMDGTRSWCHFPQRFTRTRVQRSSKVLPGGHPARPYQDERFSYIVLRRRPRPTSSGAAALEIAQRLLKDQSPEPGASKA